MLTYPEELTPELSDVLGLMSYSTAPVARALREGAGYDIPTNIEAEQAFVLHWFIKLALKHGENWRAEAKKVIEPAAAKQEADRLERVRKEEEKKGDKEE